ncbi:hypothetical protein Syun_031534 [Stephania yunnanensis]|uniref:Uncharacterized protein n=1 Tax=Stephania yunnanensis TaxID=152371 RepID=A0AAP0E3P0_9MAGN
MDAHVANDNKISSPMPAIGLYMAVATLNGDSLAPSLRIVSLASALDQAA